MAGFLVNSRGTIVLIDPLLRGFDMPLLIDPPIAAEAIPRVDAVLVTHSDSDHFSRDTCADLAPVTKAFHSTQYVSFLMTGDGMPAHGHPIGAQFTVGALRITVTPADHAWQNESLKAGDRVFADEDSCGFWIETPDGSIWAPGDSRLIPEHHLAMPDADAMLFDFSDSPWHFGYANAIRMANTYSNTALLLHHWGSVDAPDFPPFNGDPGDVLRDVAAPDRVHVLAPGAEFALRSQPTVDQV